MAQRSGSAQLPLHGGQVPAWLASRMARLGRVIAEAIVHEYGRDEFLRRLAHPFWFQSFGAVMGMDWHSSGITTSVMGALKRGLAPVQNELGLYVCGGRGRHSRSTPAELREVGRLTGVDGDALARTSRLVAKVDSVAVQDGFDLYLHSFVASADGAWTIVQQGMNGQLKQARRYHWLSERVSSFVDEPHQAIDGPNRGIIVNLTDHRAKKSRSDQLALLHGDPDQVSNTLRRMRDAGSGQLALALEPEANAPTPLEAAEPTPHLSLPARHEVLPSDVVLRRLQATLRNADNVESFEELLLTQGIGPRAIASLAFVSEVIHGAPYRFSDPARFSLAHGGKDGHPYPVPLEIYDETIRVLRQAVQRAKVGNDDKLAALKRLDSETRRLEREPDAAEQAADRNVFEVFVREAKSQSAAYGGRTVFDAKKRRRPRRRPRR